MVSKKLANGLFKTPNYFFMSIKPLTPKILLITYAFPPLQAAESFLSLKALSKVN